MMQTISPFQIWDVQCKNNSGSLISAHTFVSIDLDPNGNGEEDTEIMSINPFATSRGPLEPGAVNTVLFSVHTASATADGDNMPFGVAQQDIPDGEWGVVRILGPSLLKVVDTGNDDHLTAYGISSATDGAGVEITAVTAGDYNAAFQVGASGTTTTLDKRKVFVITSLALPDTQVVTPYGTLV